MKIILEVIIFLWTNIASQQFFYSFYKISIFLKVNCKHCDLFPLYFEHDNLRKKIKRKLCYKNTLLAIIEGFPGRTLHFSYFTGNKTVFKFYRKKIYSQRTSNIFLLIYHFHQNDVLPEMFYQKTLQLLTSIFLIDIESNYYSHIMKTHFFLLYEKKKKSRLHKLQSVPDLKQMYISNSQGVAYQCNIFHRIKLKSSLCRKKMQIQCEFKR